MAQDDDRFEPRLGRPRGRGAGTGTARPTMRGKLLGKVARAGGNPRTLKPAGSAKTRPASGRFNARGRGARIAASFPRGSGWSFDRGLGLRVRPRRVTVKARVVKLKGKGPATAQHIRYLERDGVSRDGEPGRLYSTFADEVDGKAFAERGLDDRHQFRLIVSPENGAEFPDLKSFTRDLMARMERDLETHLDWMAVDHFDTGHPHVHILIRGVTEDGKTLNIAGDYIAHGIRHRASEIMTRSLGPQTELEVRAQLEQEVGAERLTRLDRAIIGQAREGMVDLAITDGGDSRFQQLLVARVRTLETMGLAERQEGLSWKLDDQLERTLADLGRRGDIIRTMHRTLARAGIHRAPELYAIDELQRSVTGQVLGRGTWDEDHERRFLIIDGVDGRTHQVDIGKAMDDIGQGNIIRLDLRTTEPSQVDRTIAAIASRNNGLYERGAHRFQDPGTSEAYIEAHIRRLEAMRRATGEVERLTDGAWIIRPDHLERVTAWQQARARDSPRQIQTLSTVTLSRLAQVDGVTWLDQDITSSQPTRLANHGFGREVAAARAMRQQWLVEQQLADMDNGQFVARANMMATLRKRELNQMAASLSRELGLAFDEARAGEQVSGRYTRSIAGASQRYALIERSRDFSLVPWRPELERQSGREISGRVLKDGGIDFTVGRDRGLDIS